MIGNRRLPQGLVSIAQVAGFQPAHRHDAVMVRAWQGRNAVDLGIVALIAPRSQRLHIPRSPHRMKPRHKRGQPLASNRIPQPLHQHLIIMQVVPGQQH